MRFSPTSVAFVACILYLLIAVTSARKPKKGTQASPAACKDDNVHCLTWARSGECTKNPRYMRVHCKKSCGVCYAGSVVVYCNDNDRQRCPQLAKYGYCRSNRYTIDNCKKSCNKCHVNGGWSAFSSWTVCSKTCGTGTQKRTRQCNNPAPKNNGKACAGRNEEKRKCNQNRCPKMTTCKDDNKYCGSWARQGECTKNPEYMKVYCKKSCRTCLAVINGGWGPWTSYGECTESCGKGTKSRARSCNNPAPKNGGKPCLGLSVETMRCNVQNCPVDGGWGTWTSFGECSKACGGGTKNRKRLCNKPSAMHGGQPCQGPSVESVGCNTQPCSVPINGGWSLWTNYGACTKSCEGGTKSRSRSCNNPVPQNGGKFCVGNAVETVRCNGQGCPVLINGGWSLWKNYGVCTKSCGGGTKSKSRSCNNPVPQNGGKFCVGNAVETVRCNEQGCPVPVCGVRGAQSRIVGGQIASSRDWPWQIGLKRVGDDMIFCGGSLIDNEWILTAAHCIYSVNRDRNGCAPPTSGLRVILGEFDVFNIEGHEVHIDVAQVCMHPSYSHRTLDYDIALLQLQTPIANFNSTMRPVCLPNNSTNFVEGTNCTVTGFGKTSETGWLSSKLQQVQVPIKPLQYCKQQYPGHTVTERMICAGLEQGKKDSCKGDSGGPFVCKDGSNGRYFLWGAVSWGVGCARAGQPGLYTNIKYFLPWIENTRQNPNGDDP